MKTARELISLLSLDQVDQQTYSGESVSIGSKIVFGGQVLAQAVHAAYKTVNEDRFIHSLHSYFLEAGDLHKPIHYHVAEMRNGGSFSTRRVTASQDQKTIFILAASFHKKEDGFEHQISIKEGLTPPESLLSWSEMVAKFGQMMPNSLKSFLSIERPIDFKPLEVPNPSKPENQEPYENVWFKLKGDIPEMDMPLKHQILTYISDYNVLNAAFKPNAAQFNFANTMTASLDHSMWFYRDFDFNDWMLFSAESPTVFGARGLAKGNIFDRSGNLIASFAQEGLMRPIKK